MTTLITPEQAREKVNLKVKEQPLIHCDILSLIPAIDQYVSKAIDQSAKMGHSSTFFRISERNVYCNVRGRRLEKPKFQIIISAQYLAYLVLWESEAKFNLNEASALSFYLDNSNYAQLFRTHILDFNLHSDVNEGFSLVFSW